jgi:hypothetical protein
MRRGGMARDTFGRTDYGSDAPYAGPPGRERDRDPDWYLGYREGSFAGRGPRSYRRSDDRICEDVCEALTRHPAVDASDIDVRVENGEVILTGTVDDWQMKRLAEDMAEGVSGVINVRNEVRVHRGARNGHAGDARKTGPEVGRAAVETNASPQAGTEVRRATRRSTTEAATKT